jgi:hypothetical protein
MPRILSATSLGDGWLAGIFCLFCISEQLSKLRYQASAHDLFGREMFTPKLASNVLDALTGTRFGKLESAL